MSLGKKPYEYITKDYTKVYFKEITGGTGFAGGFCGIPGQTYECVYVRIYTYMYVKYIWCVCVCMCE